MKAKDILLIFLSITVVGLVVFVLQQAKKLDGLVGHVSQVDAKADQSNLASRVALEQTNELIEGQQANQQKVIEAWNDREPIGFKLQKDQKA
ncbi:MAG: hypothetical protein R2813_04455 [Flavobacteriales bacterium]